MKHKPIENWKEAFEELWDANLMCGGCDTNGNCNEIVIKHFIRKTLKQEIARVGKEIIGQDEDVLNKTADKWNKNPQKIMNRNKLRLEQRKHLQEILKAL